MWKVPQWEQVPASLQEALDVASPVFPFWATRCVIDNLIDWDYTLTDPIFRPNSPHRTMPNAADYQKMTDTETVGVAP